VIWLWVVAIVAVVGAVTVVAVGSGGALGEVYEDRPDRTIPVGRPLRSDDLRDVTFTTAVRGYRMDEVDALLARVRADLLAREAAGAGDSDRDRYLGRDQGVVPRERSAVGRQEGVPTADAGDVPIVSEQDSSVAPDGSSVAPDGPSVAQEGSSLAQEGTPREGEASWDGDNRAR
jgi:DivIVA domain-containing protein